ncbi:MAG: DUF423 domain-containing protein [Candidatus Cloacimonetes bacterium]|nr:DUF423 domain-containing protein [Candidatus Cloacimonadota bacterium]
MKWFLFAGSLGMLIGVALGAFAAHGLKGRLSEASLAVFQTGVQYQFLHSLGLLILGFASRLGISDPLLKIAGYCFIAGILFFSGSLYWLANGGPRWLGPVTPLGGTLFLVGWGLIAWYGIR